mmetsp:Transcript_30918/g.68470  ORF Transcript_30918/g.68470 Transcript_30918/m.68470 type:complete len:295 (+) Transcript_30918:68-952(+)
MTQVTTSSVKRLLFSEYYFVNFLVLSTYAYFRLKYHGGKIDISVAQIGGKAEQGPQHITDYSTWEWQCFGTAAATAAWRIYRATSSLDGAFATALGFAQLFVAIMTFVTDKLAFVQYVAVFGLLFLLLEHPEYSGPSKVEALNPVLLKERVTNSATAEAGTTYVVFMHASWSPACRHAYSTFAEVSLQYATERVIFASLDIGEWPHTGAEHGIEVSSVSSQLPTIICFESGVEKMRMPYSNAKVTGRTLSKSAIVRAFELDMRLAVSLQQKGTGADSSAAHNKHGDGTKDSGKK